MSPVNSGPVLSIVGARPQFIKLAPVHAALREARLQHVIVHTGQHYDDDMSARFFRELKLPTPNINLGVKGGGHAVPTARMLMRIARTIEELKPALLIVYGDTTSTLAGALAGAQCGTRVAHVESGLRSYLRTQPEERNRVVADHLSTLLFAPTTTAVENLLREGINGGVHRVGDPMHDALSNWWPVASKRPLQIEADPFYLCTVHRAENTDDAQRLSQLLQLLAGLDAPVLMPLHPRTRRAFRRAGLWKKLQSLTPVQTCEPLGYLDTLRHIGGAKAVLTDSGGVQREAAWLGTFCLTLRSVTEWVETVEDGRNVLIDLDLDRARAALDRRPRRRRPRTSGTNASRRIAALIRKAL